MAQKLFTSTCFKISCSEEGPLRLSMKGKLVYITATNNEAVPLQKGNPPHSGIFSHLKQTDVLYHC